MFSLLSTSAICHLCERKVLGLSVYRGCTTKYLICFSKRQTLQSLPTPLYSSHLQRSKILQQVFLSKCGFKVQVTADSSYFCLLKTVISLIMFSPYWHASITEELLPELWLTVECKLGPMVILTAFQILPATVIPFSWSNYTYFFEHCKLLHVSSNLQSHTASRNQNPYTYNSQVRKFRIVHYQKFHNEPWYSVAI